MSRKEIFNLQKLKFLSIRYTNSIYIYYKINESRNDINIIKKFKFSKFGKNKKKIKNLSDEEIDEIKENADDIYYNTGFHGIDDEKYDIIRKEYDMRFPKKGEKIGKINKENNQIKLPYWMGSMNKIYPKDEKKFDKWLFENKSQNYVISEKLDGVSCLLNIEKGKIRLYTRGDGNIGTDISVLKNFIKLPEIRGINNFSVRGELIISIKNFSKFFAENYSNLSSVF